MRLGFSSYACAWAIGVPGFPCPRPMRPIGLLERTAELGLRLVQLADNLPLDRLSEAALAAFAGRARQLRIAVEVGTRGIAPDHLSRYLEIAVEVNSPILRVVIDTAESKPSPDEVVATLRGVIARFEQAGVAVAIENHDRFPARVLADIVKRIASPNAGVCLDTANSLGALEGPEVVLEALGPLVINLHLKDFTIRRLEHNFGFIVEGCPAGQGDLNIPWLLERLRGLGRDPNAILELWPPPEADISATIAKEAGWARESVAYLRKLIRD